MYNHCRLFIHISIYVKLTLFTNILKVMFVHLYDICNSFFMTFVVEYIMTLISSHELYDSPFFICGYDLFIWLFIFQVCKNTLVTKLLFLGVKVSGLYVKEFFISVNCVVNMCIYMYICMYIQCGPEPIYKV